MQEAATARLQVVTLAALCLQALQEAATAGQQVAAKQVVKLAALLAVKLASQAGMQAHWPKQAFLCQHLALGLNPVHDGALGGRSASCANHFQMTCSESPLAVTLVELQPLDSPSLESNFGSCAGFAYPFEDLLWPPERRHDLAIPWRARSGSRAGQPRMNIQDFDHSRTIATFSIALSPGCTTGASEHHQSCGVGAKEEPL